MSEAQIRRTWPCGYQESINIKSGPFQAFKISDDQKPRPCPACGGPENCHR